MTDYIISIAKEENQLVDTYIGILTDGQKIYFISFNNSELVETNLIPLNKTTFKELISVYISLEKRNLSSQNLLNDFSIANEVTKNLTIKLYNLLNKPSGKTNMLHSEWARLFKLASHNQNNNQAIIKRDRILSQCLSLDVDDLNQSHSLFAIQTAYSIIIKLVAYYMVDGVFFSHSDLKFKNFQKLGSSELRSRLEHIENGDIFKDLGIYNLLEGDFFSWYVYDGAWDSELYEVILECIKTLSIYDNNQLIFAKGNIHDLFIDLYESIIPKEVRHSLGEYYTPNWLSEHVLQNTPLEDNWNGLDPCAGSGTFILQMIKKIINDTEDKKNIISEITTRIKAIDINPVAVLTCRINYFIAISKYIDIEQMDTIEIPVYLGDSAYVPLITIEENITFINHTIFTQKGEIYFSLPESILSNWSKLQLLVPEIESSIVDLNKEEAVQQIILLVKEDDRTSLVLNKVEEFIANLIHLEKQNWDRIWIRIIIGFLRIATLGKFSLIIGNPPWIDWKVLPDGYRETIKNICIDRHLFSGDSHTGGINLNICALIVNVVTNNWLKQEGILAFLMPKSILFQPSYSGFRKLTQNDGVNLKYIKIVDWSKSGNPFSPVTEKFVTYYIKKTHDKQMKFIPTIKNILNKGSSLKNSRNDKLIDIQLKLSEDKCFATFNKAPFNNFVFSDDKDKLDYIINISGKSYYKGRVGLGLYPKELLLFKIKEVINKSKVVVENYQGKATEKKFMQKTNILDTKYLHPVIEGPNIEKFAIKNIQYYSPFPYLKEDRKKPISSNVLKKDSKNLYNYYLANKDRMVKTDYNSKIQGNKGEFYSLTRVGSYSFAKYRVIYRNNTKWVATVIEDAVTALSESKSYLLLDHACSISENINGKYITKDEAHYICAILNSDIVNDLIINSSDSRSFKSDVPIELKKYDETHWIHKSLSLISNEAHKKNINEKTRQEILDILVKLYIDEFILNHDTKDLHIDANTYIQDNKELKFLTVI